MTTVVAKPLTLQASLIEALSGPHAERALEQAFVQLGRGGDLSLLLAMLKALVRSGLAGVALRLLHSGGGLLATEPQLAALGDQLAALPSGEIPHTTLEARLQRQTRRLRHRTGDLLSNTTLVNHWRADVQIFRSAKGNLHALRDQPAGLFNPVFAFTDQIAHADGMSIPTTALATSFLLVGVPSVWLWKRILGTRSPEGFIPPIDVIEPDPEIWAIWLAMIDDDDSLSGDRVTPFVGDQAINDYRRFLINHPWRAPATQCLTSHRPRWNPPQFGHVWTEDIEAARVKRQQASRLVMHDRYRRTGLENWRARIRDALTSGAPLHVAGFTTRFSTVIQHAMRDLASAFARRGCRFDVIKQPSPHCATVDVTGALAAQTYDMVVVIDHLRFEFDQAMPANVPYVCWIQDHMMQLWDRLAGRSVGELDLVLTHAPHVMSSLYEYPLDRCLATSNLTDVFTYHNGPASDAELKPWECDVSYVSHGAETPDQLIDELSAGAPEPFQRYLTHLLHLIRTRLAQTGWINPHGIVELMMLAEQSSRHPAMTPDFRRTQMFPQAARMYDRVFRHQALQWTANWAQQRGRSFRIHGRNWNAHPTLSEFAAGEVDSGENLRRLYRACRINLQINSYASLHQRLLDGLASGGCMVSRYNPADFVRRPFEQIAQIIQDRGCASLNDLISNRQINTNLDLACIEVERLTGLRIAPLSDLCRVQQVQLLKSANPIADLMTDDGLFRVLAELRLIPARVAADLPGFERSTFRDEQELHALLDRLVDNADARSSLSNPMRASVIAHDTYDSLVGRILDHFTGRSANSCAGC